MWPVLAGTLAAVGVCSAAAVQGVALTAITATMFWCLVAICVYAAFGDTVGAGRAARIGAVAAGAMVVLMGLVLLDPRLGWAAAAGVGLTSPPALGRAAARWRARRDSRRGRGRACKVSPRSGRP